MRGSDPERKEWAKQLREAIEDDEDAFIEVCWRFICSSGAEENARNKKAILDYIQSKGDLEAEEKEGAVA